jgi:ribonuclease HI
MMPWIGVVVILLANPSIILQFDGSLRYPRDPGVSTSDLGRMAACAACIRVENGAVVKLGGKCLKGTVSSTMTSGEVEYEGLLFGLEGLQAYLEDASTAPLDVTIQGDCKNVMEQMSGMARPRKLEEYHQRATHLIRFTLPPQCRLEFQHIPRADNLLCDRISGRILLEWEETAYRIVLQELEAMGKHTRIKQGEYPINNHTSLRSLLGRSFGPGTSLIPFSRRPELYRYMAEIAVSTGDLTSLLTIGERLQEELDSIRSLAIKTRKPAGGSTSDESKSTIAFAQQQEPFEVFLVEAVMYQIIALNALGRTKEAACRRRKKRFMLEWFAADALRVAERLAAPERIIDEPPRLIQTQHANDTQRPEEWPSLVLRWHEEAKQSQAWNETRVYWSNSR